MLFLTESAQKKLKEILEQRPLHHSGIRVQVVSAGCSGYKYRMTFENKPSRGDEVYEMGGIKLFVDSGSQSYLDSATLDFVEGPTQTGFIFYNKDIRDCEGCGGSCR
jgi:iron-sulfur cluster assembly protein